MTAEMRF